MEPLALYFSKHWITTIQFSLIAIFTLFILLSGFLLPLYLRGLQKHELSRIRKVFSTIGATSAFASADSASPTFRIRDYLTPVLFTAFIVFIFATMAVLAGQAKIPANHILAGTYFSGNGGIADDLVLYQASTLTIIIFAFLGSFIWSVQYILGRVMTRDVSPGEFYKISINMIFAIILAVAIRHSIGILKGQGPADLGGLIMPTVGFLIGLFPNFFLEWLVKTFKQRWFQEQPRADTLDLYQIEGLSDQAIFRLQDLDIHNAQNLAFANPVSIYMRTRFGLTEAVDWVDQALLLTSFKFKQMQVLRANHYRTLTDLVTMVQNEKAQPDVLVDLAKTLDTTPGQLRTVVLCFLNDPVYLRLIELRAALSEQVGRRSSNG